MERLAQSFQPSGVGAFRPKKEKSLGDFDLERWIEEHGVRVKRHGEWERGGYRWVLEECPWNGHTDSAAFIARLPNGAISAGCHHDSCQGYGWRDLREHFEPDAYNRKNEQTAEHRTTENGDYSYVPEPAWLSTVFRGRSFGVWNLIVKRTRLLCWSACSALSETLLTGKFIIRLHPTGTR
jgi:hypothetical protein